MSNSEGPVRRRRIAGETKPAAPAKKAAAKKVVAKKAPAKKAPAKKSAATPAPAKVSVPKPALLKKAPVQSKADAAPARTPSAPRVAKVPLPARPVDSSSDDHGSSRPPRRELRWFVPAVVGAIAILVAGIVLAVHGIADRHGNDDVAASNEQAATAAGTAAQTVFSFTYDKLPEHLTASKALMTKSFAKEFDKIAPALTELAPQRKIQVEAVTRDAGPIACGDNCSPTKATILVFIDQARLIGGSKEPTVFGNRITMSMVKQNGTWLVADIRAL